MLHAQPPVVNAPHVPRDHMAPAARCPSSGVLSSPCRDCRRGQAVASTAETKGRTAWRHGRASWHGATITRPRGAILAGAAAAERRRLRDQGAGGAGATAQPVRLGILNTFTGINAARRRTNIKGMTLYFDHIGWTVAGRKIELIKEDDQFNPQIGLQKIRKLVESDHVDLVCGPQASNVAIAVLNYCKETKTLMLVWAGTDSITWDRVPILFRPGLTSWQLSTPMAEWVDDNISKEVVLAARRFRRRPRRDADLQGRLSAQGRQDPEGDAIRRSAPAITAPISPTSCRSRRRRSMRSSPGPMRCASSSNSRSSGCSDKIKLTGSRR